MLSKIIVVKRIGRFNSGSAVPLWKQTIIYGDNGRGKTTLTAILRSLQMNDPQRIIERHTLGESEPPQASFLATASSSPLIFNGTQWSQSYPLLEIFDSAFIADNVYSGGEVGTDQ